MTNPARMPNQELLDATIRAVRDERRATAELIALLAELDARRLYLGEGCASLFTYCTQVLRLSEHAAYHRIEAARAARRFPIILEQLADGSATLTTVAMLRPHLTEENHEALLGAAQHKTKKEVAYQIACLAPGPAVRSMVRRVPTARTAAIPVPTPTVRGSSTRTAPRDLLAPPADTHLEQASKPRVVPAGAQAVCPPPKVEPLASDRYLLRVTLSAEGLARLRRAQDLARHAIPDGDPAAIVERALTLLVNHLEKGRTARTPTPRPPKRSLKPTRLTRLIPAGVKRAVWARDRGRCAFVGSRGRCTETGRLEFHHLLPFARGGPADVSNIALRCRAHNQYESELVFGPRLGRRQLGPDRVDGASGR